MIFQIGKNYFTMKENTPFNAQKKKRRKTLKLIASATVDMMKLQGSGAVVCGGTYSLVISTTTTTTDINVVSSVSSLCPHTASTNFWDILKLDPIFDE